MSESGKGYSNLFEKWNCCVIIPTYNNDGTLAGVIDDLLRYTRRIIVINDGSTDNTREILKDYPDLYILNLPENMGKGYAIRQGIALATTKGFDYAFTIDSDGQHKADSIPDFFHQLEKYPGSLIMGSRNMKKAGAPGPNRFAFWFSNFWFWVETGLKLPDTQCGYRLYPLKKLSRLKYVTRGFEFELEILVRTAWNRIAIIPVPIQVYYPPKGKRISHFRPVRDFLRISLLNTVLVILALLFVRPFLFIRDLNRENIKKFIRKELLNPEESNARKTASVMLGTFMSSAPVWGWQNALSLLLAVVFRLNKIIVLVFANISIPPMIPLIIYLSYLTGGLVLGTGTGIPYDSGIDFEFVKDNLIQYIVGALVFALAFSVFMGLFSYIILSIFRRKKIVRTSN